MTMRRVEAWEVAIGMSLHYKLRCKPAQGIVTAMREMPKDRVFITLTSGTIECSRSTVFELVEVK